MKEWFLTVMFGTVSLLGLFIATKSVDPVFAVIIFICSWCIGMRGYFHLLKAIHDR